MAKKLTWRIDYELKMTDGNFKFFCQATTERGAKNIFHRKWPGYNITNIQPCNYIK